VIRFGEEILRITQRHAIEFGVGAAGGQRHWVEVAGYHFRCAGLGGGDGGHAGARAEIQHALAAHPLRALGEPARQYQAAGPAEAPVGRLFENAPGFLGVEGALHITGVDQPQCDIGTRQCFGHQAGIAEQFTQGLLQLLRRSHGAGTRYRAPRS